MTIFILMALNCLPVHQVPQTALDEIAVLKLAQQIDLKSLQAKELAKFSLAIKQLAVDREKELASISAEPNLAKVLEKMFRGDPLTEEDQQLLKKVETAKTAALGKFQTRCDLQFQKAIANLTDEQLFAIVLRKGQIEREKKESSRIRTATEAEWPKVRDSLAAQITDDEYFQLLDAARSDYEQRTGQRVDLPGSKFSTKAAGIDARLAEIRASGKAYLQQIRDDGVTDERIIEISERLLKPAMRELRTWPPPERYPHVYAKLDNGRMDMADMYFGKVDPFAPGLLLSEFLTGLLVTPGASETLGKLGERKG